MSEKDEDLKEQKREMVLESINFYKSERNKALFQINSARLKKKDALSEEKIALNKSRHLKKRLMDEVNKNLDVLKKDDLKGFVSEEDEGDFEV